VNKFTYCFESIELTFLEPDNCPAIPRTADFFRDVRLFPATPSFSDCQDFSAVGVGWYVI
jgi:hypothetical protein